ncbi:MAG: S41 family peptidase [Rubrivivax sp.]
MQKLTPAPAVGTPAPSGTLPAYLRMPSTAADEVFFVCDDDVWSAPLAGGRARRLTDGLGEPAFPHVSPDGRWLAFVGRDEHHPEVWLMPAAGGPARRLTWLGADTQVRGWTPDGQVLFVSNHGQPFIRNHQAYTMDPAGGLPQVLTLGQVNHLSFGPGGARVIGRNTADPARWKRYRGGTAGHLWVDASGDGQFSRLAGPDGNLSCPMWLGDRIWFLSDHEGTGNLYSSRPDGIDLRRHTDHADFYARHAATDGRTIVYQCGATLWRLDPTGGDAQRIEIEVPAARTQATRRVVNACEHLADYRPHPKGHSVALELRGKPVTMPLWEGGAHQHGDPDGVRYRHPQWLADGRTLIVVSDAGGEERIERHRDGAMTALPWTPAQVGRVTALAVAPHGPWIAFANQRNELWVGDAESGAVDRVDHSDAGRMESPAWSACGGWLAYSAATSARHRAIKLLERATGRTELVTEPEFQDYSPSFDPDGKYLYFLSLRTFDPVYDAVQFELSFPRAARPYLIALQADGGPPFEPAPRGLKGGQAKPEDPVPVPAADGATAPPAGTPKPLRVDRDGLTRRVAPFPVKENRFAQLAGAAGGRVLWTVMPIAGAHGRGGHKDGQGTLERFSFETNRAETAMTEVNDFRVAADHHTVLVRSGQELRAIGADHKAADDEHADDTPSRKTGWLDLARVRLTLDPRAEWRQMLREVWRLQRDHFWVADMSGIDWAAMYERYAPLVEHVATRAELSDLIWELQGELGTSHAYEMGGDHRKAPALALGQLAAVLHWAGDGRGYEIRQLVSGDAWDPTADSPLAAVAAAVRAGERIVAVGGQPVTRERPPQALLLQQAGNKVTLTLASDADGTERRREVLVTPLADETPVHYRAWVEHNRAWVHQHSAGKVGYFHLPDMMSAGFAEFHRYFRTECDRDALIVDVRYNRGGHVSELLLEKVARRRIGYNMARWMRPSPYPDESRAGPVVALTNEHAGSDGDIFSHGFKLMKLGTLVGTRTWGGVIGIWPRHTLADGTTTTQPEFSFWFEDVGWGVENHGTDPQIEVDNAPQDSAAGRDRQLEVALQTALEAITRDGVSRAAFPPRPMLATPPLPTRG